MAALLFLGAVWTVLARAGVIAAGGRGIAIVTVHNSNHFGIAGYYAMMALPHDMIGVLLVGSDLHF